MKITSYNSTNDFYTKFNNLFSIGCFKTLAVEIVKMSLKIGLADTSILYVYRKEINSFTAMACVGVDGIDRADILPPMELQYENLISSQNTFINITGKPITDAVFDKAPDLEMIRRMIDLHNRIYGKQTKYIKIFPIIHNDSNQIALLMLTFSNFENCENYLMEQTVQTELESFVSMVANVIISKLIMERNERLVQILNHTSKKLRQENLALKTSLKPEQNHKIIGDSAGLRNVFQLLDRVVDADVTVLILGETGTGKELVAKALHEKSYRAQNNFVVQNCAAIPDTLLESELFGYKKGAFSGAIQDKKGLIEQAHGGTLFLDEIGDIPSTLQAKLLRVLQDKVIRPVGANNADAKKIDVRIIAATHQDLKKKVAEGGFREDLYYRLSVFPIRLPPLRERREDIPALLDYYIGYFAAKYNKEVSGFTPLVLNILTKYHYPGNIRDLRNIVERCVLLTENKGHIDYPALGEELIAYLQEHQRRANVNYKNGKSLKQIVAEYEAELIKNKLRECRWNQTKAAKELKIARRTIIEKIQKYDIDRYITNIDSTLQ